MFQTGYDCQACIEDFGVKHPMTAVHTGPTIELDSAQDLTTWICTHHDLADPFLTIDRMDTRHAMHGVVAEEHPDAPPPPLRTLDLAEARSIINARKRTDCPFATEVMAIAEPDHRGLVAVLYLAKGAPQTVWLRDRELAYHEEGW